MPFGMYIKLNFSINRYVYKIQFSINFYLLSYLYQKHLLFFQSMNSTRRYEFIEYENGRIFGQKKTCDRGTIGVNE